MWRNVAQLVALVVVVSVVPACKGAPCPARPGNTADPDAFAAVFRLVEQWRQGWEVRSMDALAPLYRHDDTTVVVRQGVVYQGWPAAETALRRTVEAARSIHLTLGDGKVAVVGEGAATFVANLTREISDGALTTTDDGVVTLVLAHTDAGWAIVAEHYSYPPGS